MSTNNSGWIPPKLAPYIPDRTTLQRHMPDSSTVQRYMPNRETLTSRMPNLGSYRDSISKVSSEYYQKGWDYASNATQGPRNMAGSAWGSVCAFFAPIGEFFSSVTMTKNTRQFRDDMKEATAASKDTAQKTSREERERYEKHNGTIPMSEPKYTTFQTILYYASFSLWRQAKVPATKQD